MISSCKYAIWNSCRAYIVAYACMVWHRTKFQYGIWNCASLVWNFVLIFLYFGSFACTMTKILLWFVKSIAYLRVSELSLTDRSIFKSQVTTQTQPRYFWRQRCFAMRIQRKKLLRFILCCTDWWYRLLSCSSVTYRSV